MAIGPWPALYRLKLFDTNSLTTNLYFGPLFKFPVQFI